MKTLSENELEVLIKEFVKGGKVISDEWIPELVVGIESAGDVIGRVVYRNLNEKFGNIFNYESINFKRKTTSLKDKYFRIWLKHLPSFCLYPLRIIENKLYLLNDRLRTEEIEIPEREGLGVKILLVDDAIDSGKTILKSINYLKNKYTNADIRIFTITVTSKAPKIEPDFNYYNENISFPWSIDFKPKK